MDQPVQSESKVGVLLAIETSQRRGAVAARGPDGVVQVETLRTSARHEDDLMPAIDRLFVRCGWRPNDLVGVAVSIGPGGFTGLRIAVTTAKMFAEVLSVPVAAVPSALVAAEAHHGAGPVGIALAAKRERFWWTVVDRTASGRWQVLGRPGQADATTASLQGLEAVLADRFLPASMREVCESAGLTIIDPPFEASNCLAVGQRMLQQGESVDPLRLTPLYARQPEAVVLWDRRAGSEGAEAS